MANGRQNDAGNMAEFERILHDTQNVVRAYIASLGVTSYEVDDVAQEVYLAFYKGMKTIPEGVEPIRWLKGIARRLSNNHFRKMKVEQARRHEALAELLSGAEESQEEESLFACSFDVLKKCMESLTDKSRQMMMLKYGDNLNATAIANETQMSAGAVRMTLLRIRESMRDCVSHNMKGLVENGA
jgi:RNA polymerase sigma-70 factor (ECF subfamily)